MDVVGCYRGCFRLWVKTAISVVIMSSGMRVRLDGNSGITWYAQ